MLANGETRDDLTGEHALTDAGQLVLAVLFFGSWTADSFFLHLTTLLNGFVPIAVRAPVGAILLVVAAVLAITSHRLIFGVRRRSPHVVRSGVFAVVRHPMYLSELLLYAGVLLLSLSLIAGGIWIVAIGFLHRVARTEERLLAARFGEAYAAYARDVPMWIPRLRRPGPGPRP